MTCNMLRSSKKRPGLLRASARSGEPQGQAHNQTMIYFFSDCKG
jgi:hypothetical protein